MSPKAPQQQPGDVLGERYMLKKNEWTSPLGPVWLARDRVLDRAVLVQLLSPTLASDAAIRRTFQKAAARIAQIGAPGLLQVYDIGEEPAFAVFEHASGGRLAERLKAGPMRPTEAARATLAIARALESLHDRGTWHGSLSPATVLFDEEGRAKLMAVGLADTARSTRKVKADPEQPEGYRTPEQDPIPADADRYALAALLCQMLTGSPPDAGGYARTKRRGIPPEIDALIARALSADPTQRPGLDEFEGTLAPFARVLPPDAKQPRFAAVAEFRWLVPVILIVVLAVVALTIGVQFARDLGTKSNGKPTPSKTAQATASIDVTSVADFDPNGDGTEHPDKAKNTIDGSPVSKWTTLDYKTADVGGKKGVGLVFDLGQPTAIGRLVIETSTPDLTIEIRAADANGSRSQDFSLVTTVNVSKVSTSVPLPRGTKDRYVLLWITRLAPNQSNPDFPYSADVNEVQFFAP